MGVLKTTYNSGGLTLHPPNVEDPEGLSGGIGNVFPGPSSEFKYREQLFVKELVSLHVICPKFIVSFNGQYSNLCVVFL